MIKIKQLQTKVESKENWSLDKVRIRRGRLDNVIYNISNMVHIRELEVDCELDTVVDQTRHVDQVIRFSAKQPHFSMYEIYSTPQLGIILLQTFKAISK